jgi:DNA-binding IscR family transcriptional regulator
LWTDLSEQIRDFLDGITLAQVLDKRAKEVSKEVARQGGHSRRSENRRFASSR